MMDIIRSIYLILFLVFLFSTQNYFIVSLGMNIICKESERTALLSFKQHLKDPYNSLSSWSGENCCRWTGVVCSNTTDHVVQLHLQQLGLGGELNPSLQELKQLRHLDLSWNDFDRIPEFLGTLQSLRYLNLSHAGFSGMIPHQLGNISYFSFHFLNLSSNYKYKTQLTDVSNFQWLSHLSSLEHLDLSNANLENASSNWFHVINQLPSLLVLRLSSCSLSGALPTSLSHVNLTSLAVLDLSWNNNLNSTLPEWLYSLTNLQQLDLSCNSFQGTISASIGNLTKLKFLSLRYNQFEGEIPITLGNLCKLQNLYFTSNKLKGEISGFLGRLENLNNLYLGENQFSGPIPLSIGRLSLLKELDLSYNKLNGSLPESLGNLSNLVYLLINSNAFEGIVSEVHFANLKNLQSLYMDSLVLKISPGWVPPFQLYSAHLGTCHLGPEFPKWIRTQKKLRSLDLSRTGISGTIPTWFWNIPPYEYSSFDLSHNELHGELPKVINTSTISLKSNQFAGQLPRVTPNVKELDLSNNSFSGHISTFLCNPISKINYLHILDLSNNLLSGNLSDCWVYWASLKSLRLGGNKITGKISSSMGFLHALQSLHLQNNSLSGELPLSLRNCTWLMIVDIGENVLTGRLPIWLGESFPDLIVLRIRQNKFYGDIPKELCDMTSLQMLDIAHNNISGSIPRCISNFSAMAIKQKSSRQISYSLFDGEFVETTSLVMKGRELEYSSTLRLVTNMDLSKNSLSGEIPEELTSLIGLISLNLSENLFTGKIPEKIGNMGSLESLDFSKNGISGAIPQSISSISSLSHLNVSYNNLSGEIPSSTQLQLLTELSFIGNQELCGSPLKNCNGEEPPQKLGDGNRQVEDEVWFEMKWFYMSMGVGFVLGFWVFLGVMVLKKGHGEFLIFGFLMT